MRRWRRHPDATTILLFDRRQLEGVIDRSSEESTQHSALSIQPLNTQLAVTFVTTSLGWLLGHELPGDFTHSLNALWIDGEQFILFFRSASEADAGIAKQHVAGDNRSCRGVKLMGAGLLDQFREIVFVDSRSWHDDDALARLLHQLSDQPGS